MTCLFIATSNIKGLPPDRISCIVIFKNSVSKINKRKEKIRQEKQRILSLLSSVKKKKNGMFPELLFYLQNNIKTLKK